MFEAMTDGEASEPPKTPPSPGERVASSQGWLQPDSPPSPTGRTRSRSASKKKKKKNQHQHHRSEAEAEVEAEAQEADHGAMMLADHLDLREPFIPPGGWQHSPAPVQATVRASSARARRPAHTTAAAGRPRPSTASRVRPRAPSTGRPATARPATARLAKVRPATAPAAGLKKLDDQDAPRSPPASTQPGTRTATNPEQSGTWSQQSNGATG